MQDGAQERANQKWEATGMFYRQNFWRNQGEFNRKDGWD